MKRFLKYIFCSILLLSTSAAVLGRSCDTDCNTSCNINSNCNDSNFDENRSVRTTVLTRDQASNSMMELVGWQHAVALPDMCNSYGAWYLGFEYQRTFKPCRLAESFLGSSRLNFEGSEVANRTKNAIVADYLGLPSGFSQSLEFRPQIQNYNVNFGVYFGLDDWCQGSFFRIFTTLNHTKWDLFGANDDDCCFDDCSNIAPVNTNNSGSLAPCFGGDTFKQASSLQEALGANGDCVISDCNNSSNCNFNSCSVNPLTDCGALLSFCDRDVTKLAGIMFDLGWNFYNDPCYHLGLFVRYEAPTGNRPCGDYLFEPISGNGKHHALGAGLTAHANLWDDQQYQSLAFWVEGNVVHLFKDCQTRTFDLCSGPYSRYMLLRQFEEDGTTPTGNLLRAACFTRQKVEVDIDVRVDASFKLAYQCCNWGADLGYNVYYQGEESIKNDDDCNRNRVCNIGTKGKYGIAGLTGTCCNRYGFVTDAAHDCSVEKLSDPATNPVNITKPNISVFDVEKAMVPTADVPDYDPSQGGPDTQSFCLAWNSTLPDTTAPCHVDLTAAEGFRPVSNQDAPVLLNPVNAIDYKSGLAPSILTHKVFGYVNYIWADECAYNPFFGLGAEAEFTANSSKDCDFECGDRNRDARLDLNQWGVFIKGGMSF